jgi:hypothetical protein
MRADRLMQRAGPPQGRQDGQVDGRGIAFGDLVGDLQERGAEQGKSQQAPDDAQLPPGEGRRSGYLASQVGLPCSCPAWVNAKLANWARIACAFTRQT